jgi:hypothetical protein
MKYPSKYSNGKEVTAAQFITEIICERIAKRKKKDLHYRFWVSKEWAKEYRGQIGSANKLLDTYDPKDIIEALRSNKGLTIYSLRAPHLKDIIDQVVSKNASKPTIEYKEVIRHQMDTGRKDLKNKSNILDKLKDIDNGNNV